MCRQILSMELWNTWSERPWNPETPESWNPSVFKSNLKPWNLASLGSWCKLGTLPFDIATLEPWRTLEAVILYLWNLGALKPACNLGLLGSCNLGTLQPQNPAPLELWNPRTFDRGNLAPWKPSNCASNLASWDSYSMDPLVHGSWNQGTCSVGTMEL